MLSLDLRGQGERLINFSVWNGAAAPNGHISLILKVTLPPSNGMIGESKYHHEDIKWDGSDKGLRQNIIMFTSKWRDKEFDIRNAMYQVRKLFV